MELADGKIIARKEAGIGWLIFNNPERRNAVSVAMWAAIPEVMADFAADPAVRVIVLTGAGEKAFVAGADISEFEQTRSSAESVAEYNKLGRLAHEALAGVDKPTIAMIRGVCVGGGAAIALSCDLRLAAANARFAVPAAKLGLGYGYEGLKKLVEVVGPAYAKEIFYTARLFSATEAHEMGLVNRVLPLDELEAYVREYCATIAANAPLTIKAVKRMIAQIVNHDEPTDLALCEQLVQECFASEDYIEGRRAFMEKRPPQFQGR